MITIIPAGKGGSTPTPTPGQQLKIVSNDDSIKVFENDEDETERNIERYNFLAAEDIDNGASCYFNFVEEDNAGAGAKNLVEYVINTKEGRKINFSMICPYSPTSLDDFTIKITGDVLEDDGFYIELYSDPGDGEGNRYQGYFGVIWFYSASFHASGGAPDQQFFVQVAGDKTNVNWQWLGLSPEAYERLVLLQDEGYYMRDFWDEPIEPDTFEGFEELRTNDQTDPISYNIIDIATATNLRFSLDYITLGAIKIRFDQYFYYFGTLALLSDNRIDSLIGNFKSFFDSWLNNNYCSFLYDFKKISNSIVLTNRNDEIENIIFEKEDSSPISGQLEYTLDIFSIFRDVSNNETTIKIDVAKGTLFSTCNRLFFYTSDKSCATTKSTNRLIKNITIPSGIIIFAEDFCFNWMYLRSLTLHNNKFFPKSARRFCVACNLIETIDLSGCDMTEITDLREFCKSCTKLTSIDFSGCDLSYFATAASSSYSEIFSGCSLLTTITAIGCNADTVTFLNSVKPAGATVVTA